MAFVLSNLDFSIFAPEITVMNGLRNKMVMQKSLYIAAIKSMRMAAAFSSIYPSINVRKIEYIEGQTAPTLHVNFFLTSPSCDFR